MTQTLASKAELLAAIESDREQHIALLQAFIQKPSPNPPGDTTEAAQVIFDYLKQRGVEATIDGPQKSMPNIVADFKGGKGQGPRVIMNGHIDVFPVGDASEWTYGPWSGHNDGKYIHGRGCVDMKAGTAASVIAYTYLQERKHNLKGSLGLTVVSDEETGGKFGSRYLLNQSGKMSPWRGDCMLNAEPGGIESVRFGEKGTLRLTFTVKTIGAHGAYTHLSEGANRIAVRFVQELLSVESIESEMPADLRAYLRLPEVKRTTDDIMGKGASDSMTRPTLNIGTWHGGVKVNMIPDQCVFEADIRLPVGLVAETVLLHVRKLMESFPEVNMTIQEAASNPASYSSHDHPLLKAVVKNAKSVTGIQPVPITSIGATDCKFWRYLNIPTYVYGVSPKTMAATNEKALIDEFLAVIKTHALAIWDYLNTEKGGEM